MFLFHFHIVKYLYGWNFKASIDAEIYLTDNKYLKIAELIRDKIVSLVKEVYIKIAGRQKICKSTMENSVTSNVNDKKKFWIHSITWNYELKMNGERLL